MPHSPSFDDNGLQFAWNSTSIKLAETCLYKYKLKMIDGWQPNNNSVHLLFGGWYAAALESYHKYVAEGMSSDEALVEVVHEALQESWVYDVDDEGDPIPGTGGPWESDHNSKTRPNLIRTIIWYVEQFGADDPCKTLILSNGQPAVEHSFRLEIDNDLLFAGHLDRLVEYSGKPYIQDQKTTGSTITQRYFDQWSPDTQMSLYTWAGQIVFNQPVKGVIIDAAQIAVGFSRFERGFTFRDQPQLDEWYDSALHHIEAARTATRENHFPMNPSSCNNFGGCEFRNVCNRSPHVRQQFLQGDFVKGKIFDPLDIR